MEPRPARGPRPRPVLRRAARGLRIAADRAVHRFVNGVDWLVRDPSRLVDQTPFEVVHRHEKRSLRRYLPLAEDDWPLGNELIDRHVPRRPVPILLVPPLMVKPFIFDLVPQRSFVRTLLGSGFDVFLVDFGEPDRDDALVRLDQYVLEWLPEAIAHAVGASEAAGLSLVGYCMGGLFALMSTAVRRDSRVRAIVTIASPLDSHEMGILTWVVRVAHQQIDFLSRRLGNVPGDLSSVAFQLAQPFKTVSRYADLFYNLWNQEFVDGFDALNQWTRNFIDYPGEAFRQFVTEFVKENRLRDGRMVFGEEVADLGRITCPLLAFAGQSDQVVPVAAARRILDLVGSADKELRVVPGGHMGVFAGRRAPTLVWETTAGWLAERVG